MADDDVRGAEVYSIRLRKSAARGGPKSRSGLISLGLRKAGRGVEGPCSRGPKILYYI
jgi:hypothetical protein